MWGTIIIHFQISYNYFMMFGLWQVPFIAWSEYLFNLITNVYSCFNTHVFLFLCNPITYKARQGLPSSFQFHQPFSEFRFVSH